MMSKIKIAVSLFSLLTVLAGCSSNSVEDASFEIDEVTDAEESVLESGLAAEDTQIVEQSYETVDPVANIDTVFYFDFDQAILNSAARAALTFHAEALKASPRSIRLEGHADERGSREYNMALGERRANAVRDFLRLQGVPSSLIETVSYGEEQPASIGSYDSSWSQNRRVELR